MIIKLDIAKGYDKLSWQYLEEILRAHGFSLEWVEWVISLVTSPFYSILLNGSPIGLFTHTKGIRQGHPLSPFLFILTAKGLRKLIQDQVGRGRIRGLSLHEDMEKKTHQQFVDDTMLMGNPSVQEARDFEKNLNLFATNSAFAFNLDESQVFCLNTTPII